MRNQGSKEARNETAGFCTRCRKGDHDSCGYLTGETCSCTCQHPPTAVCESCFETSLEGTGSYIGAQFLCESCDGPRMDSIQEETNAYVANSRKLVWTNEGRKFIGARTIVIRVGDRKHGYELNLTKDAANMLAQSIHEAFKNDAQSTDSWTGKEV